MQRRRIQAGCIWSFAAAVLIASRTSGTGIEIFGTSNTTAGLEIDFTIPATAVPYDYLLGTYSRAGGTTPQGIVVAAAGTGGIDSVIQLRQGASLLYSQDDLTTPAGSRDSEIRTAGMTGRPGAFVTPGLPTGSYTAAVNRFAASPPYTPQAASVALDSGPFPFTVTAIRKPGGDSAFSIDDVLINGVTLVVDAPLSLNNGLTAESGAIVDAIAGGGIMNTIKLRNASELRLSGASFTVSQTFVGDGSGSNAVLTMTGGSIAGDVMRVGQIAGASGRVDQSGGSVYANSATLVGNTTGSSLYNLSGGTLNTSFVSLGATGRFNLAGGTLSIENSSSIQGAASNFSWTSGTLELRNPVAGVAGLPTLFPAGVNLTTGRTLHLVSSASIIDAPVTIAGGALQVYNLPAAAPVTLSSGRLVIDDVMGIAVAPGTYFTDHLALKPGTTIEAAAVHNAGLIDGGGTLAAPLVNNGDVRADLVSTIRIDSASPSTNNARLTLNGGRLEFTGALTNAATGDVAGRGTLVAAALTNAGDLALSGGTTDVYAPVTNASGGRMIISGGADATFWGDVTNASGASIKVAPGSTATFFGSYGGGGITGGGTTYFEADVTPGFSPATVDFAGSVVLDDTSRLVVELAGATPGTQYDQVRVGGSLQVGGALELTLLGSFHPLAGQSFDILDWGSLAGNFSSISLPALDVGLAWNTSQLYTTGVLSVAPNFLAADFDESGTVNGADLTRWRTGFGIAAGAVHGQGDATADGGVRGDDYLVWQRQFGQSTARAASSPTTAAVPEPASILLGVGLTALLFAAKKPR